MKSIVFGGSGFLGSHVADELTKKGHEVTIFDIKKSPWLKENQKMIVGDILDWQVLDEALEDVDIVYNFAGFADVDSHPYDTIKNIEINAHILNSLKDKNIQRYLYASTLYVFGNYGSFYRDSKVSCEMYIESFHKKYGIPYTILRYGSLYGERTNMKDRISIFVKEALETGKITYHGDGEEVREYINVKDAARCSVEILDKEFVNENITISGSQSMKIKDLMTMIVEILGIDDIEFLPGVDNVHYNVTPCTYRKREDIKYVHDYFVDLGPGIMESVYEIERKINEN